MRPKTAFFNLINKVVTYYYLFSPRSTMHRKSDVPGYFIEHASPEEREALSKLSSQDTEEILHFTDHFKDVIAAAAEEKISIDQIKKDLDKKFNK